MVFCSSIYEMAEESEEACLVNPKSPLNAKYTEGSSTSSLQINATQSISQTQQSTSVHQKPHDSYDINDDIILSQFHADAIKQVRIFEFLPKNTKKNLKTNFFSQIGGLW